MSEAEAYAQPGHNLTLAERFSELNAEIHEYLSVQHSDLRIRAAELFDEFQSAPEIVADDDDEKTITDLGVRVNNFLGLVEGQRKNAKEEPLKSPKLVEDFFKALPGKLPSGLDTLRSRLNVYKNKKMEAERRRVAEERARALAAQEAAERERREAVRLRLEAEEARKREAEAAAAEGRRAEQTAEEALAVENERVADERAAEAAAIAVPAAPATAPMVKTESGAKSGQIGKWVARDIDRDTIDLEALRPLIAFSELQQYANAYARQYKDTKPLRGCRIVQEFTTTFRS